MIDYAILKNAPVRLSPYRYLTASGAVSREAAADIRRDFPPIDRPGFFPLADLDIGGAFRTLIDDLQSPTLADTLSEALSIDLSGKARMITVRRLSKASDGRIHNDSESKICTMLLYLNDSWDLSQGGGIRALNGPSDMDDFAAEVAPLAGNVFAFARSDCSWHGHPPFAGERWVVQTMFLASETARRRKESRGRMHLFFKRLNPFNA